MKLGGCFQKAYLVKWSILTTIFQMGWFNHQLGSYQVIYWKNPFLPKSRKPKSTPQVQGHHVSHTIDGAIVYLPCIHVHPLNTNEWPLKSDHFSREYIDSNSRFSGDIRQFSGEYTIGTSGAPKLQPLRVAGTRQARSSEETEQEPWTTGTTRTLAFAKRETIHGIFYKTGYCWNYVSGNSWNSNFLSFCKLLFFEFLE